MEEYFSAVNSLCLVLQSPEERPNGIERECRALSIITRLESLSLLPGLPAEIQKHFLLDQEPSIHAHVQAVKSISQRILRGTDPSNALLLLALLSVPF